MKAIIQKVLSASVTVGERCIGSIEKGMCVLLGIAVDDSDKELDWMANKLVKLRIFDHPETGKPWDADLLQCQYGILVVSQFTLQCVLKGNKPDFHNAMKSEQSQEMYNKFISILKNKLANPNLVQEGEFGAFMQVHIQNDGPVTIPIESPESLKVSKPRKEPGQPKQQRKTKNKNNESTETQQDKNTKDTNSIENQIGKIDLTENIPLA